MMKITYKNTKEQWNDYFQKNELSFRKDYKIPSPFIKPISINIFLSIIQLVIIKFSYENKALFYFLIVFFILYIIVNVKYLCIIKKNTLDFRDTIFIHSFKNNYYEDEVITIIVNDDNITISSKSVKHQVPINNIVAITKYDNYIVITLKLNIEFLIPIDAFDSEDKKLFFMNLVK